MLVNQHSHSHENHEHKHKAKSCGGGCCCGDLTNDDLETNHNHEHAHSHGDGTSSKMPYILAASSLVLLLVGLFLEHALKAPFFSGHIPLIWYSLAYLPVGIPVIREGIESIANKDFFNEFTLMVIATLGAFILGQYPEGVTVMLFYAIGELFQDAAVNRAKNNIKSLLDVRPQTARVKRGEEFVIISPQEAKIGDIVKVLAGEKVPLDGKMLSASGNFNTIALTGESVPQTIINGETAMAGMLNLNNPIELEVSKTFENSAISRIIEMVQSAASRKAPTELFIRKFAKIYTPIVFLLAVLLTIVPFFVLGSNYIFGEWFYRACIFLVIACPCALVISIPLGYFGGIGAGSKNGILFKGGNFIDLMAKVNTLVLDKTGTLTEGVFEVQEFVVAAETNHDLTPLSRNDFLSYIYAIEKHSNHPIAKAITDYAKDNVKSFPIQEVEEIHGHGLKANINGKIVLAGNARLLKKFNITYPESVDIIPETIVIMAINDEFAGYITIADKPKADAARAIRELNADGLKDIFVLSGDKSAITKKVANSLGIRNTFGDLLPADKVKKLEELKADKSRVVAFVGDGINDAPALALADVGIAMGGLGADAAIETADVVIQTDQPSKIATAIEIGKETKKVVWQNIILAFGVKIIVLILGAGGLATMWEAVFADVGVALLAILNAIRIQNHKFK